MRIVCPSCEAEYEVPDSIVAAGPRKVRCAKCSREWMAVAPPGVTAAPMPPDVAPQAAPAPAPAPAPPPQAAAMPQAAAAPTPGTLADAAPPLPAPPPRQEMKVKGGAPRLGLVIAWLLTLAVLGGGVGVAWLNKAEIVRMWPPSARIYKLLDL